jgi:MFS family permease
MAPPAWGTSLFFQQVHLAEVRGWALMDFVALFPLYTAVGVASSLLSGVLIDKVGTPRITMLFPLPWVLGFALLSQVTTIGGAALGLCLLGIGHGFQTTVLPAYWAEFYGTRHIGALKALAAAVMVLASALGPGITGALIDAGYEFPVQMIGITAYFLAGWVLMALGVARATPLLAPARAVAA